jgi:hypothetical protein
MSRQLPRRRTASIGSLLIAPTRQLAEHDRTKEANDMTDLSALFGAAPAAATQPAAAPAAAAPAPAPAASGGSWLDDIITAEATEGSRPFAREPGTFIAKVLSFREAKTNAGGAAIALDVEVVATQSADEYPVGFECTLFREVPGKFKSGAEDVKGWLECIRKGAAAEAGREAPPFDKAMLQMVLSDAQPFAGYYMKIRAYMNKAGSFTKFAVEYVPKSAIEGAAQ